ncbi:MAG: hypothetical protein HYV19_11340 [Gemmatimonadetes bacterium]|nr:hypothetical protein [Gemmatimonadota bacterium]
MARSHEWLRWTFVCALAPACARTAQPEAKLSDGAALECARGQTMLLRELPDGRFALMQAVLDSAHLASTLHSLLPPRPGPRVIMVSLGPDRAQEVAWIVRAIEAEGWTAYKPDSVCLTAGARPWFMP